MLKRSKYTFMAAGLCLASVPAMATDLRMLTSFGLNTTYNTEVIERFIESVNERDDSDITIQLDGPGVVPAFEQVEPTQAGVYDMLYSHGAYHTGITGVGVAYQAVSVDPDGVREHGVWDYVDEHYQEIGLKLISMPPLGTSGMQFILKEPLPDESPALRGLRLRSSSSYVYMIEALGGSPQLMPAGEVYSGIDRGVVDGAAWGINGAADMGWHEVAGYFTKPTYGQTYSMLFMNLEAYNNLSEAQQELLLEEGYRLEMASGPALDELAEEEWAHLESNGMQESHFPDEDAERLDSLFAESVWRIGEDTSPAAVQEMRELAERHGLSE